MNYLSIIAALALGVIANPTVTAQPPDPCTIPEPAPAKAGATFASCVDPVVQDFIDRGAFPGAVLAVGYQGELVHLEPYGYQTYDDGAAPVTAETLYDLASLTKVVATTTMAMILVDEGRLELDTPVQDVLPGFIGENKEKVTVRHLLTHSSGLPAWAPLYEEVEGKTAYVDSIQAMPLSFVSGAEAVYSDLGVILLGAILEDIAGEKLDAFVRQRVFEPLGMENTLFLPPPEWRDRIAPTEFDSTRGDFIHGEVHDENARAIGGVAPHAGLFSTAGDLTRFAQMILNRGILNGTRIISEETVERFTRRAGVPGATRAIGWDTKSAEGYSSAGALFTPNAFGHTGFTGTSMWFDPERELFVILLTNRVHPTRDNQLIRKARPAVADAVVKALD